MDKKSLRNRAFSFESSKKSHLFSFCFSLLTVMSSPCYRQRLKLAFLLLPLLCSCRAASDFSSDQEMLGLWLGLAESGGCAEVELKAGPYYQASLWGFPSRLCTADTRSGGSYAEYIELARTEHYLVAKIADKFRGNFCALQVDTLKAYPSDPALSGPVGWNMVKDNIEYSSVQWIPVRDVIYESQGFLKAEWGMDDAAISSSTATNYAEYLSLLAGIYLVQISTEPATLSPDCQVEAQALMTSFHPGWLAYQLGDVTQTKKKIAVSRCYYGSTPPFSGQDCTTLGPQF